MGRLRCAFVILIAVVLSTQALAGERKARVRITLHEIPAAPEAKVEVFLAWGARVKDPPAGWLKSHQEEFSGPRSSRSIETDTETTLIDSKVDSFIVYGRVLNKDGTVLGYVPAKFHDISEEDSLTQIEVEATARSSFEEAFLDSYPLEYNRDQGYLESDNVRPVLRSFKLMIEYAGQTGIELSDKAWQRFHTFLAYLKTYSSASPDPNVAGFYAEFLNELVGIVRGKSVFEDQELNAYIHDQLKLLYGKQLADVLGASSRSLQRFLEIEVYESCLDLADTILTNLTPEIVLNEGARGTISGLLSATSICGQYHFEEDSGFPGADRRLSDDGAKFLATSTLGRSVMEQYRRVVQLLFDNNRLSPRSTGRDGEIVTYYVVYNQALEGSPGL